MLEDVWLQLTRFTWDHTPVARNSANHGGQKDIRRLDMFLEATSTSARETVVSHPPGNGKPPTALLASRWGSRRRQCLCSGLTPSRRDQSLLAIHAQDLAHCCDFPRMARQREKQARLSRSFHGFQAAARRNTTKPKYVQVVVSQVVQSTAAFTILSFFWVN